MKMLKSKQWLLSVLDRLEELKNMRVITKQSLDDQMAETELDLVKMPLFHLPRNLDLI